MASEICTAPAGMACTRTFSYPLSHLEQAARQSPFTLRKSDGEMLELSEGFQVIRQLLANQQNSNFCEHHQPSSLADKEAWLLHRDITHALIYPVLHIYREACRLARSALCSRSIFDLELAFRGEARGAFSWLQCLIIEEEDWCLTRGCPACVVTHVLQSEPTIRLILTACRLSRSLRKPPAGRHLPLFDFWRASLRRALDNDPFWGPAFSKSMEERAGQLEIGLQQLIRQCCALTDVLAMKEQERQELKVKGVDVGNVKVQEDISCIPSMRPKSPGKRPMSRAQEEQSWMERVVVGCWTTLLADAARARESGISPSSEELGEYLPAERRARSLSP